MLKILFGIINTVGVQHLSQMKDSFYFKFFLQLRTQHAISGISTTTYKVKEPYWKIVVQDSRADEACSCSCQSRHFLLVIGWQLVVGVGHDVIGDVHIAGVRLLALGDGRPHLGGGLAAVVDEADAASGVAAHPGGYLRRKY